MIKLSELKDDEVLIVNNELMLTKAEFLNNNIKEDKDIKIYTTNKYVLRLDAKDVLYDVLDGESKNMYDKWRDNIQEDINEDDIRDLQDLLDRILERNKDFNVSYCADREVQIDNFGEEEVVNE